MNKSKLLLNNFKKKYYRRMMNICFDRYFESERYFWFRLFKRYFEKLHNLKIISCEINKTES